MHKQAARQFFKTLRKKLTPQEIEDYSLSIANMCLQLPIWEKEFFHLYLSISKLKEINTEYILHILHGKDKHVVVAKSNFDDFSLQHYLLTDSTKISLNQMGIPEPDAGVAISAKQLDVVFVPLLACDEKGNRVGYGKGFYDRFLKQCKPDVLKIGLSFFAPISSIEDVYPYDVQLDYLVTPEKLLKF